MDVERGAIDRPAVSEGLHAVDQGHDAVGLLTNQVGELSFAIGHRLLEKLCGAPDAGQWVLDLVRQHGGEGAYRAGGAAVRHLAVDAPRNRLLGE